MTRLRWTTFLALVSYGSFTAEATAEPLSLDAAIALARAGQPSLRQAEANTVAAHARVGQAFSAYLPNLSLVLQGRWDGFNTVPALDPTAVPPAVIYPFTNTLRATLAGALDERIYDFGRTGGAVASARALETQARTDLTVAGLDVELAVLTAYTDAQRGRALERVEQLAVAQVEAQLQRARALYKATLRPEIDMLSAETQLAQAQIGLLQAQNTAATALVALRAAIGPRAPVQLEPDDRLLAPLAAEERPERELIEAAFATRGEIRSAEAQALSARQLVRSARGDYFPALSLGSSATVITANSNLGPSYAAFVTFTVTQPVFNGLATLRAVQQARANVDAAQQALEGVRIRIAQEVSTARLAVQLASASWKVADRARQQAERQLTLAQARYETKVGTFVELNDARNGLITALVQEVTARHTLSKSRGQLARALGRSVLDPR